MCFCCKDFHYVDSDDEDFYDNEDYFEDDDDYYDDLPCDDDDESTVSLCKTIYKFCSFPESQMSI